MPNPRSEKILVVDDEPIIADTLVAIFQRAGYVASAVYNGEEALACIANFQPSLVITDVVMPGLNGIQLARLIRSCSPNCHVLLFSGNADTQRLLNAAREEGEVFDVLAKPVPPPIMLAKVASLLS